MSDDTRRVLEMLSQGKISVQDAKDLLDAMNSNKAATDAPGGGAAADEVKWLRIVVDKQIEGGRHKEVNLRVPVSLVRAGMRLSALMPRIIGTRMSAHGLGHDGIDFTQIDPKQLDALIANKGDMVIDVDNGRSQVRISCE